MQIELQRGETVASRYAAHHVVARDAEGTAPQIGSHTTRCSNDETHRQYNAAREQAHYFTTAGFSLEYCISPRLAGSQINPF